MKRVAIVEIDNGFLIDLYFAPDKDLPTREDLIRRVTVLKGQRGKLEEQILELFRMRPRGRKADEQPRLPEGGK